ncbi:MAG: fumarylacetoacetate hydrolase family protein [Nitrospira sp.]|nr:fumarylacetoacetate hydrolase family protein [Nitrospira sp.]MBP6605669.1 fumarylacetoacetate hydrolase family protein [Nitrospira sp.]HQY58719.1 fumarylacetoacetate hydrolase family protein [Nitrospira sp.]HRA97358.1 fumarylacetoacetate hydrolase family protein [Nitrospira sp.]
MKLVSFQVRTPVGTFTRIGAQHAASIVDLNMAQARYLADQGETQPRRLADAQLPATMLEFLEGGPAATAAARRALDYAVGQGSSVTGPAGETIYYDPANVRVTAPLPNPASLRDFIAFEEHIAATSKRRGQPIPPEWYKAPVYYKGNHRSIIGPDDQLRWPLNTQKLDYELELACVIGRKGIDIAERDAVNYIAGYTIMNDFSARDIQFQEMACRLGPAKGKDFATAIGPCIVTPDDIQDLASLRMIARINGEIWSEGRFGTIHWSFAHMIEHVSRGEFLYPGDLFGSGTVGGGCGLEIDRYLKPGDVVELEIQPIGILRTTIAAQDERSTGRP